MEFITSFLTVDFFLILGLLIVSGLVQGFLGFAFSLVAMTLMPSILGFKDAITFMALMNLTVMILAFYWTKGGFSWKEARAMVIGGAMGVPIGVYMVVAFDERILIFLLGLLFFMMPINHFVFNRKRKKEASPHWELPVGLMSGTLAGGFNMGGPPVVAYVYSKNWDLNKTKAVMASVYLITAMERLFFVGITGQDFSTIFGIYLAVVVPVAIALRVGIYLGTKISLQHMKAVVFIYLGIMGVKYLIWG
jgi:uncharacterized membrane protein YfcA